MQTLKALSLSILLAGLASAQTLTSSTTLASAVSRGDTTINLTSCTGVQASTLGPGSGIFIDREYMTFTSNTNPNGTGCLWNVKRNGNSAGGVTSTHASGAIVWYGIQAIFDLGVFDRVGACTAANFANLPLVETKSGSLMTCDGNGKWSPYGIGEFYVPPTQCTFAATTAATTNTYVPSGASNVFVLNGSLSAAGTNTLSCNILVPTSVLALRGAIITDITLLVGSQTTVPTSVGTSTLASITFPTAATVQTASTVTPVAIGGTVTSLGQGVAATSGFLSAVTTAGSFYSIKTTYATVVDLSKDLTILQYTYPFLQSAAAVTVINTPGLLVHYRAASTAGGIF